MAANNYLAAVGQTKGHLVQVDLTATTSLTTVRTSRSWSSDSKEVRWYVCGTSPTSSLGADNYE